MESNIDSDGFGDHNYNDSSDSDFSSIQKVMKLIQKFNSDDDSSSVLV